MVVQAVRSGWIAPLGPMVDDFEARIAERCGRAHAVALSSGTAALHLALLQLGAGPGTAVVIPTLTFVATANAVRYTGADLVFVDSDVDTGNMCSQLLERGLRDLAAQGVHVAAVVPVDLLGHCADYTAIQAVCASFDIPILSDAAEALGSSHAAGPAGSFGIMAALSFNGNKVMTTSGGGMLVTDDVSLAARARHLSTQARQPVAHYEHLEVGYNYRLSNVLAALGLAQLERLNDMIGRRRRNREYYAALVASRDGIEIFQRRGQHSDNCWLTALIIDPARVTWAPGDLAQHMSACNIETRPLWKPMHLQPVFAGVRSYLTGAAEKLFETGLTLPSGSNLSEAQLERVGAAIDDFLDTH